MFKAGREILDNRISDELLKSGGGILWEEQGDDEETSKTELIDWVKAKIAVAANRSGEKH